MAVITSRSSLFAKTKTIFRGRNSILVENYNPYQEEEPIKIQKVECMGESSKFQKILNFRNSDLKTCNMPT